MASYTENLPRKRQVASSQLSVQYNERYNGHPPLCIVTAILGYLISPTNWGRHSREAQTLASYPLT